MSDTVCECNKEDIHVTLDANGLHGTASMVFHPHREKSAKHRHAHDRSVGSSLVPSSSDSLSDMTTLSTQNLSASVPVNLTGENNGSSTRRIRGIHARGCDFTRVKLAGIDVPPAVLKPLVTSTPLVSFHRGDIPGLCSYTKALRSTINTAGDTLISDSAEGYVRGKSSSAQEELSEAQNRWNDGIVELDVEYRVLEESFGAGIVRVQQPFPHWFTSGYTDHAPLWMPCRDTCGEPALWSFTFDVPAGNVVLSSGTLVSSEHIDTCSEMSDCSASVANSSGMERFKMSVSVPTEARHIGFAVGPFELISDPKDARVTAACLPGRLSHLEHTVLRVATPSAMIKCYEELFQVPLPVMGVQIVFVHAPARKVAAFSGLIVCSDELLHGPDVLDLAETVKEKIAVAMAYQWAGVFLTQRQWSDSWIVLGIAQWAAFHFLKQNLGNSYYRARVNDIVTRLTRVGEQNESLMWKRPLGSDKHYIFPGEMCQSKNYRLKSFMVVYMLEKSVGNAGFLSVVKSLFQTTSDSDGMPRPPSPMGKKQLLRLIKEKTSLDKKMFFERWVNGCGYPPIFCHIIASTEDNVTVKTMFGREPDDDDTRLSSATQLPPPMPVAPALNNNNGTFDESVIVRLCEVEGDFEQSVPVSFTQMTKKLPLRTKWKQRGMAQRLTQTAEKMESKNHPQKAKEIREEMGRLLWARVDPEMTVVRCVVLTQPEKMWENQVRSGDDVLTQIEGVLGAMKKQPMSNICVDAVAFFLTRKKVYWKCKAAALHALAGMPGSAQIKTVENVLVRQHRGLHELLKWFRDNYMVHDSSVTDTDEIPTTTKIEIPEEGLMPGWWPRPFAQTFESLEGYYLQREFCSALSEVRDEMGFSPRLAWQFYIQLLKSCDNTGNGFSDNFLVCAMVNAACSFKPNPEDETKFQQSIGELLQRRFGLDCVIPSHSNCVGASCLRSMCRVCPEFSIDVLWSYASPSQPVAIRLTALEAIAEAASRDGRVQDFVRLLTMLEFDLAAFPRTRRRLVTFMRRVVPKSHYIVFQNSTDGPLVEEKMWALLASPAAQLDSAFCTALIDLYTHIWRKPDPRKLAMFISVVQTPQPMQIIPEQTPSSPMVQSPQGSMQNISSLVAPMSASTPVIQALTPVPSPLISSAPGHDIIRHRPTSIPQTRFHMRTVFRPGAAPPPVPVPVDRRIRMNLETRNPIPDEQLFVKRDATAMLTAHYDPLLKRKRSSRMIGGKTIVKPSMRQNSLKLPAQNIASMEPPPPVKLPSTPPVTPPSQGN